MADINSTLDVAIYDENTGDKACVNSDNELLTITEITGPSGNVAEVTSFKRLAVDATLGTPAGATDVIKVEFSNMSGTVDTLYTITNTKTLTISSFTAGAEQDSTGGTVIELYEDPNGDLSVLNVIDVIFASGNNDQFTVEQDFVGDGTRRILLRRRRLTGGAVEVFGRWAGFEQ